MIEYYLNMGTWGYAGYIVAGSGNNVKFRILLGGTKWRKAQKSIRKTLEEIKYIKSKEMYL